MGLLQHLQAVFPRLDLAPTMESTMIKLVEEAGELAELIGKVRGMSGEDKNQVVLKLLVRDLSREIAERMARPGGMDPAEMGSLMHRYQELKRAAETGQLAGQAIETWIARELLDVIQTCATFAYQLNIDLDALLQEHRAKLVRRGYLSE
jgi:NTP pyrophosphatase (non-canonical NTP hydrolase)